MEKFQFDAEFIRRSRNFLECHTQLIVGGNHTAILVAVRISQHDLLQIIHRPNRITVDWQVEQCPHNLRCIMQIVNGFEQRHSLKCTNNSTIVVFAE
ncbi:hypothetical protein D3C73_718230 [compost metagenome]